MKPACFFCCLAALPGLAAAVDAPTDPGRLFFSPAERAQLERARTRAAAGGAGVTASAVLRYDGLVVRSDGATTRWIDGRAEVGAARANGLKPGQLRADGKVYEPYQIKRPATPPVPTP